MGEKLYTVTEITQMFADKYAIPYESEYDQHSLRQKISRALKDTYLWDEGVNCGKGNKKTMCFTLGQVSKLEKSKAMYDFLRKRSTNGYKDSKSYKQVKKETAEYEAELSVASRINWSQTLNSPIFEFERYKPINTANNRQKRIILENAIDRLMLRALFNHFFEFDRELFVEDFMNSIENREKSDGKDPLIQERLENPERFYYKERDITPENKKKGK